MNLRHLTHSDVMAGAQHSQSPITAEGGAVMGGMLACPVRDIPVNIAHMPKSLTGKLGHSGGSRSAYGAQRQARAANRSRACWRRPQCKSYELAFGFRPSSAHLRATSSTPSERHRRPAASWTDQPP